MVTPGEFREKQNYPCHLLCFNISNLVCNVILVALYSSQVYAPHTECTVNDTDITMLYDVAFRLGLTAMIAEFLVLMCPYILPLESSEKEVSQRFAISRTIWLDWFGKFCILAATTAQVMILTDEESLICSQEMGTLTLECKWLAALVIA